MHLVYLDESGNSGLNLNDPQQPVFCLCAMVVEESRWQSLEKQLAAAVDATFADWRDREKFEVHASDLRVGTGQFSGVTIADRIKFRDAWMAIGAGHNVRLIYRTVRKKAFADWLVKVLVS